MRKSQMEGRRCLNCLGGPLTPVEYALVREKYNILEQQKKRSAWDRVKQNLARQGVISWVALAVALLSVLK